MVHGARSMMGVQMAKQRKVVVEFLIDAKSNTKAEGVVHALLRHAVNSIRENEPKLDRQWIVYEVQEVAKCQN